MDPEKGQIVIAPAGLAVLERYRDIDSGKTQVQVGAGFDGAKRWHTVDVPRQTIASTSQIVGLADYDFPISSLNARQIVEYLAQYETKNRCAMALRQTTGHLGWQVAHGYVMRFLAGPETFISLQKGEMFSFFPPIPQTGNSSMGSSVAET